MADDQPEVVPQTPAAPGQPRDPATGQFARDPLLQTKFGGDWAKADESYRAAVGEISRVHQVAEAEAQRAARAEAALATITGGRPASDPNDPLEALRTELGLPPEPFRNAIRHEAQ